MLRPNDHIWRLRKARGGLGLACAEDGLFLGHSPLLERKGNKLVPRPQAELKRLLARGFGFEVPLDRVTGGLDTVASALNAGELCRARIAAVHLRIPDLPDAFAQLDMQIEDVRLKLDRIAKAAAAGDWDPDKHPRTGTAPNPGWFAPTEGGDSDVKPTLAADEKDQPLHLPPGKRDDEAGDLLEWIANSKPEDSQAIRGEIKRLYSDVGDSMGAGALNQALSEILEDSDNQTRQWVLDNYEIYTRTDPAEVGQFGRDLTTGALLGPLFGGTSTAAPTAEAGAAEVAPAAEAAASDVWKLGWAARVSRSRRRLRRRCLLVWISRIIFRSSIIQPAM